MFVSLTLKSLYISFVISLEVQYAAGSPAAFGIIWSKTERGDVVTPIFAKECYPSYKDSPNFIFWDLVPPEEKSISRPGYNFLEGVIDSSSGSFIDGIESSDDSKKLKFKLPASANFLGKHDPYILIVDLNTNKKKNGNLLFNVSADKALFWDSTAETTSSLFNRMRRIDQTQQAAQNSRQSREKYDLSFAYNYW
ncbi:hypothetical protein LEP1GSC188_3075 [Leptospira weilii serovar Topaz str. LT2116]|uniref:Uncharacterized protein n=1 Tax=Leptospira weilii serovar Topaz str. LT2116 TaxID=1088540 RepID=M3H1G9_9LEPT|nr:hypothetical protein LEP1GSC188_3075 [Leptospira weilii serovar Topaz str. LT2116]